MLEGRFAGARRCFAEVRRIFTADHGEDHLDHACACQQTGQIYVAMDRWEKSLGMLQESLETFPPQETCAGFHFALGADDKSNARCHLNVSS